MADHFLEQEKTSPNACITVNGPIIIGAGPSGLALGAGLKRQGVPYTIIEKANCIASLWQNRTYDRLKLHLPKQFCELPYLPFPESYPEYPTKNQFVDYLKSYAKEFEISPRFNETVYSSRYDQTCGLWRIRTMSTGTDESKKNIQQRGPETTGQNNNSMITMEYVCKWIVVATGENAEKVEPEFEGLIKEFTGRVMHACEYKSGKPFEGKRVLVVGCGNTGMEVSFDLCNHNALPFMVVRNSVHVLPREILGKSTFGLATWMLKWMSIQTVDKTLLIASRLILGDLEKYGIKKPSVGPLELKGRNGKTPVLDVGTSKKIKSGEIKIVSAGIKRFTTNGVELDNGQFQELDFVILATGYRSNVPSWLEENELFSKDGYPKTPYPNGWKGKKGLYAVGFTRRGLAGASFDAIRVADDIVKLWKESRLL